MEPEFAKLSAVPLVGSPAPYSVKFIDDVNEEDREHWIAGTKVLIVNEITGKTMATKIWYSFDRGLGNKNGGRQPWSFAISCSGQIAGPNPTRFFVDQILIPAGRE